MLAVVCDEHREIFGQKLSAMQKQGKLPSGKISFEPVKSVVTDCIVGINEDYVDIELTRGIESDRKLT